MDSFSNLLVQVDAFIRKFYKNEMLKGVILFVGLGVFSFLLFILLEYFGRFNSGIRAFFFFTFIACNVFLLWKFIVIPISKFYSFGKIINRYQASEIIGKHFSEVNDRLLNTLQLNEQSDNSANYELIRASVNQKSVQLNAFSFSSVVDFKKNYKYLKYSLPVFLLFLGIAVFSPSIIKEGSERIVNYEKEFKPVAPFTFELIKKDGKSFIEGDDVPVALLLKGKDLPEKVYIVSNSGKFVMNRTSKLSSFVVLKKQVEDVKFYFEANGFQSESFSIPIQKKASIGLFCVDISYPSYLGRKDEIIKNAGDLSLPEGSIVKWNIASKNAKKIIISFGDSSYTFNNSGFNIQRKFRTSSKMSVKLYNEGNYVDSLMYSVEVLKDVYPRIDVTEKQDSISEALKYFEGNISDDYGLVSLNFVYKIKKANGSIFSNSVKVLNPSGNSQPFRFGYDFRREKLDVNDKIEYYFIVNDNDGVNGSKQSRSSIFVYELPSLEELNEKRDDALSDSKKKLDDLIKKSVDFKKNILEVKKNVLNNKSSDWKQQNKAQQLEEERNSLEKELKQLQQEMSESLQEKNQLSEMEKELMEKEELLEKLLDEVIDDELKDLLKQLEDLMKKQDKNQVEEKLDKLEYKADDMNKQLDRSLELLKRMQVNEKIDDIVKELKELSKEQEELRQDIEDKKIDSEEGVKKQDEINKKFDELKEDMKKLQELNDDLKKPLELGDQEEKKEEISKELKDAKESLGDKKDKKASKSQENSSKKMEDLALEMEDKKKSANQKQDEEDMSALRNILESLMTLSFTQEFVLKDFDKVRDRDPYYKKLGRQQRKIVDDTKMVEDSLNAIASRQPKIASFINKELNDININFKLGLENIDEHHRKDLSGNLQFVMTSYNNLALMLNESLQQMQMQMQSQMPGSGSCDKPGGKGSKPKDGDSDDMKEILKKQLEKMKKGNNPGGDKPGDKEGMGMMGLQNKEIAKMAAQQTAIRQKLEELRNELNKEGKGKGNQLNSLINELEKQEKDLINKNFGKDMIRRQQEILTRLLESEKALKERGFDEKRESKSANNILNGNQKRIDEYNNQKLKQLELLQSVDPVFRKYYKDKANDYFNSVL